MRGCCGGLLVLAISCGSPLPKANWLPMEPTNEVNGGFKRGEWRLQTTRMEAPNGVNGGFLLAA